jgi:hypothetical protein
MWLFEPNSPCIATFTGNPCQSSKFQFRRTLGNLIAVTRNLPHWMACNCFSQAYGRSGRRADVRRISMLWTITIVLLVLWILGMVSSYTLGGWIHVLLVLAIIVLIFNLLSGRRAV